MVWSLPLIFLNSWPYHQQEFSKGTEGSLFFAGLCQFVFGFPHSIRVECWSITCIILLGRSAQGFFFPPSSNHIPLLTESGWVVQTQEIKKRTGSSDTVTRPLNDMGIRRRQYHPQTFSKQCAWCIRRSSLWHQPSASKTTMYCDLTLVRRTSQHPKVNANIYWAPTMSQTISFQLPHSPRQVESLFPFSSEGISHAQDWQKSGATILLISLGGSV